MVVSRSLPVTLSCMGCCGVAFVVVVDIVA